MARPEKNTVDYFPHDTTPRKTITILKNTYGLKGPGFWWELLALLGRTPGHAYDCKKKIDREYLAADVMHESWEFCLELLNYLADLEAIDSELWRTENIIWSDNFVLRLGELYKRRANECPPKKPTSNGVNVDNNSAQASNCMQDVNRNSQTKLNKTKLKETKEKKKAFPPDSIEIGLADFFINLLDSRSYEWPKNKDNTLRKPDPQKWAAEFDKLIRIDGRDPERIRAVLTWCQTRGNFWQPNILSPANLRDKWGRLTEEMKNGQRKQRPPENSGPGSGKFNPAYTEEDYGFRR